MKPGARHRVLARLGLFALCYALHVRAQEPSVTPPPATVGPAVAAAPPPVTPRPAAPAAGGPVQLRLDASEVRGNQELPKVLYIVPWKDPAMVAVMGRPVNSLIDEALAPVDRDVFRRQGRYFQQLYGEQSVGAGAASPTTAAGMGAPAAGAPASD